MNYSLHFIETVIIFSFYCLFPSWCYGQEENRVSPLSIAQFQYEDSYMKIVYSRPQQRGRKIFGDLVPWGKVWRTGANEATEITLTRDMIVQQDTLKTGTYSLFTIPHEKYWTIIFNTELGLWGSYNYKEDKNALILDVVSEHTITPREYFTIDIMSQHGEGIVILSWEYTQVSIPIRHIL